MERPSIQDLHQWIRTELHAQREPPHVEVGIAAGVPAIEICRLAERRQADLMVLGRKQRSQLGRLLLGDTADAVARRSGIPCLFVPPNSGPFRQVLVALDGSERGMLVLRGALGFALGAGASLRMMTVEAGPADEPAELASTLPLARSARLESELQALLTRNARAGSRPGRGGAAWSDRRGDPRHGARDRRRRSRDRLSSRRTARNHRGRKHGPAPTPHRALRGTDHPPVSAPIMALMSCY